MDVPPAPQPRPLPKPPTGAESKGRARFNFAPASNKDNVVYGAERPGQPKPNPDMPSTPRGPSVPSHVVDQWCAHMRSKGIKRVLCLLSDSELSFYSDPLLPQLAAHFETSTPPETESESAGGETASSQAKRVLRIEPQAEDALVSIVASLKAAVAAQEPVVVFCSTGQARTGMVLSFWLHHAYALSIVAAVTNVIEHASAAGATRRPAVEQVVHFAVGPTARSALPAMRGTTPLPPRPESSGGGSGCAGSQSVGSSTTPRLALGTPRVDDRLHVVFLQCGGTIDKDYPKGPGGYAFEIADPAVARVLAQAQPANFTHDIVTVCRKDSQDMAVEDRQALVEAIRRLPVGSKAVVTHGTDTMIDTAQYVAAAKGIVHKTVVFTGSMRPQKFVDSDAAFNIGVALGALNVLGSGTYLAMHGRVHEASSVRRDGRSGLFVGV